MPLAAALAGGRAELELETPALSGTFDVVFRADEAGLRLQLFPDVGGKVLDLFAGTDGVRAETPAGGYRAAPPYGGAAPHVALLLAPLFAELCAPVDGGRVLGERSVQSAIEVQLAPALAGGQTTARLAADGSIERYDVRLGVLEVTLASDGAFTGRGVRGRLCR
jgi:hypothetical protein